MIITLVGLSVSHTRALFLKRLSGTALQENILPILNPAEMAKQFFPEMFQGEFLLIRFSGIIV